MHTHRLAIYGLLVALAAVAPACQSGQPADPAPAADGSATDAPVATDPPAAEAPAPDAAEPASEPVPVALGEYDRVWAAAVDVLRDWQFVVNRRDRRFGIISTDPQPCSAFIEPWRPDAGRSGRTAESTFNYERRTARITLAPVDDAAVAAAAGDPAATPYRLAVVISVDRRHHPPRQLNTAAVRRLEVANARDRFKPIYTESGLQESFWEPVGRDPQLERQLASAILRRAGELFAQPVQPVPPAAPITKEPAN